MNVLFIGGTGLISSACSELTIQRGMDLSILNRSVSKRLVPPEGTNLLVGDVFGDENHIKELIRGQQYDVVVDWIAFKPEDVLRDIRLFGGITRQYIFISSASGYQKPPLQYLITEETPLENPFWQYSRDKIACEQILMNEYRENQLPVTIVRPSLTYGPSQIPLIMGSWNYPYTIVDRIKRGEKVVIPGDGTSLWVLTWNEDFAKGLIGLFGRKDTFGEAFHITSDEVLTWNQIYDELGKAIGIQPKIVHVPSDLIAKYSYHALGSLIGDKSNSVVFDNSKIKRFVPYFHCDVTWAEGVRRSLTWHEADPKRMTIDASSNQLWDKIIAGIERAYPNY